MRAYGLILIVAIFVLSSCVDRFAVRRNYEVNKQMSATVGSQIMFWSVPVWEYGYGYYNASRELVYLGVMNDTLRVLYREYFENMNKPAYTTELTYKIIDGKAMVVYKDVSIEVVDIKDAAIIYLIKNDPKEVVDGMNKKLQEELKQKRQKEMDSKPSRK